MSWLKQSTAASCIVGPILDSAGAEYASAVIGDLSISKNGGTLTALASAATLTYIANGMYTLALTTGNTDTVGRVEVSCNKSTYQMPQKNFLILLASVFDALITNATNGTGGLIAATAAVSAVAGYVGASGAAINGTNANTLSSHDPGVTLGTSTLTQTQVTGGAYSIQSASAVLGDARIANLDATISSRGTSTLTQTQVSGGAYALNSSSFAFNTAMDFTTTQKAATLARVTLVDTTTTNTDMRGTNSAALASAWTATRAGYLDGVLLAANYNQRTVAVTGSNHVAADIHELQAGVITASKFAAGAVDANTLASDAATEIATAVAATQALSRLDSMIESDGAGQFRFDTISLSMGAGGGGTDWTANERTAIRSILGFDSSGTVSLPTVGVIDAIKDKTDQLTFTVTNQVDSNTLTGGGSGLDAAATRAALGLASANLDTQLSTIDDFLDTEILAIKAKTDLIPASPASTTNITAGTITTVTNLTNAPTNGDLTAAMKASVTAAVPTAATIAAATEAAILNEGDATALLAAIGAKVEEFLINEGDATATLAAIAAACNAAVVAGTVGTQVGVIHGKLPTNNIADETLLETAIGSPMQVGDVTLAATQPNDITFTGTVSLEPTTTDANALQLRGNGTGRALDLYSSSGHAVTMYAGLNAFDIYAQGNAIYAQSNTSDAVVLYAGSDANGLHVYGGQSSGSAVKLQTNGVGCGLEVLSGGEGFAAHIGGMKIDGVVTLETGLIITQSTASTAAVQIVGNGSGPGLDIQGGENSDGIRARSGASYGYGFCVAGAQGGSRMWSTGANGTGLTLTGAGTGDGLFLNPGETGSGLHIYGGSTSGDAVHTETSGSGSVYFPIDGSGITIGDVTLAADQHVIVDSGTVTTLSNLPTAPTNWLTAAAVNADAVTKIQAGLATPTNITAGTITNLTNAPTVGDFTAAMKTSLNSATPQNTNILAIKEKTDQFRFTVANQVDANALTGGVPEPSGARTVTITVDDGTDPLENAVVRLTSGATTWRKITDPDGLAIFSIDDATWEVSVTRGSDYTGITDTLVVADDVAETYSLDAISFTPSTPPEITAYLTAIDNNGIIQSGVDVSIQYVKPYGTGTAFDGTLRTETSDVNGLVQFTGLVVGATYRLSRGASRRHPISVHIPTDATSPYALPSIVGDS